MIEVNSYEELRTTRPSKSGEIAMLKRYYSDDSAFRGSGDFVGVLGKSYLKDDGGTRVIGDNFYWRRIFSDPAALNVFHFGARGDGITDDSEAVKRMYYWAKSLDTNMKDLPIRFPGGKFRINPVDLSSENGSFFGLMGDDVEQGNMPRTMLVSDKSENPVFTLMARRVSIRGICWDGGARADVSTNTGTITPDLISNIQPFMVNRLHGGQVINITCFKAQSTGGTVFKFQDTLDTKFDQIYSSTTYGRVFDVGWSDTAVGSWDHSTAIELCNANFQKGYGDATLYMPRSTRGILRNVWIEHTRNPGNLSDGQWIIDALSLEGCGAPLNLDNAGIQIRQLNLQAGAKISTATSGQRWLSSFEYSWRRDECFGTLLGGSMRAGYYSGHKVSNPTDVDQWYRIGLFFLPSANQQWVVEMISKSAPVAPNDVPGSPVTTIASGKTYINLQRSEAVWADMYHFGSPAVLEARYKRSGTSYATLWVKLRAGCGETMFNTMTTGPTRFEAGNCSLFSPDMQPVAEGVSIGTLKPLQRFGLHNGLAGVGANEKGLLTLASKEAVPVNRLSPTGFISVNINGVDRKIPYYD